MTGRVFRIVRAETGRVVRSMHAVRREGVVLAKLALRRVLVKRDDVRETTRRRGKP